jgi:hypothetical protein
LPSVQHVQQDFTEPQRFGLVQPPGPRHRGPCCRACRQPHQQTRFVQDAGIADVAGTHDVAAADEEGPRLWPQQAVRVGDPSDAQRSRMPGRADNTTKVHPSMPLGLDTLDP